MRYFTFTIPAFLGFLFTLSAHAVTIQLPKTGQTGCWNETGGIISCAGTGQDGEKQKGLASPVQRFTDNGNGTVTDNLNGLIWLKDANCFAPQTWSAALASAKTLAGNNTQCSLNDGSVAGAWRLPNRKELQSLIDRQSVNPALPTSHPFSNVQSILYWSATSSVNDAAEAWIVFTYDGSLSSDIKSRSNWVWPVRGGQ